MARVEPATLSNQGVGLVGTGFVMSVSYDPLDTDSSFRRPTPRPVAPFIPHSLRILLYTPGLLYTGFRGIEFVRIRKQNF